MKLQRWFETQNELEANISHSGENLSRFIGMKNRNKQDLKNIDKIHTCLPDRQAERQLELSSLAIQFIKRANKIINR